MIPKIIHYCWFGKNPKDEVTLRCIASWRKQCPDYEIIEWNENNSDININAFVREAYENRKWAFVSDYVRLKVLYECGGIYLDTDVELLKSLDEFLDNKVFLGDAEKTCIGSSTIGAKKGSLFIKLLLDYYNDRHFKHIDGTLETKANNVIITEIAHTRFGFVQGNENIGDEVRIYPTEVFSPFRKWIIGSDEKLYSHENFKIERNTCAIHYNSLSWINLSLKVKCQRISKQIVRFILPSELYWKVKRKMFWKKITNN